MNNKFIKLLNQNHEKIDNYNSIIKNIRIIIIIINVPV